jgi:uncharacterized protein
MNNKFWLISTHRVVKVAVILLLSLTTALFFSGCKESEDGKAGVAGTNGTDGTNGTTGTNGTNGDDLVLPISLIQGEGHLSPYNGQRLTVQGIVISPNKSGRFYIQSDATSDDGNVGTSEGLYIYYGKDATGDNSSAAEGDLVKVKGVINEYFAKTGNSFMGLSLTQMINPVVTVISNGNTLPTPVVLGSAGRGLPEEIIDNDTQGRISNTSYDEAEDGIDLFESVEGMLVQVDNAVVVGSNDYGSIAVVADDGTNTSGKNARGGMTIKEGDFNPERIILDDYYQSSDPNVAVGAKFDDSLIGVMSYVSGTYDNHFKMFAKAWPAVTASDITADVTSLEATSDYLTVATYNVNNLAGTDSTSDFDGHAAIIVNNLKNPDIIALQEVGDNDGSSSDSGVVSASSTLTRLKDQIANVAGGATYAFTQIDPVNNKEGGKPNLNIRVAIFYRTDRITLTARGGSGDATTDNPIVNSGGPQLTYSPGRILDPHRLVDPTSDVFENTRRSLAAEFVFNGHQLFMVNNHLKSKSSDEPLYGQNQPPTLHSEAIRNPQATLIQSRVKAITDISADAKVFVLGDFNDFYYSNALKALQGDPQILYNEIKRLPENERYTYVYKGNSQALDHILVSKSLRDNSDVSVDIVHVNSEFLYSNQASDHDPMIARYYLP